MMWALAELSMQINLWSYAKLSAAKNTIVISIIGKIVLFLEWDEFVKGCKMYK